MKSSLKKLCMQRLHDTFGPTGFRPGQYEAVQTLLSGKDAMCILPTGAGKSLCWQLPAVVHDGLTVVVSPLIALMRDQVQHLLQRGIPAVSLDSLMEQQERDVAIQQLRQGNVRIAFVSPERLMQPSFRQLCREIVPWMVVVDEAHCVVQWGEHFRPAYGGIGEYIASLPKRPVICALTATADAAMQLEIRDSLGLHREKRVVLSVLRSNLVYDVRTTLHAAADIIRLMQRKPCKTVVFCRTRQRTEQLASVLVKNGFDAAYYHAGLTRDERMDVQQHFADGKVLVLCSTSAFGMGVDIPGIRRIIHEELPDSVIDYAQQTGRAGRDGEQAECILLLEPVRFVRRGRLREREQGTIIRRWLGRMKKKRELQQMIQIVLTAPCIAAGIAAAFGQKTPPCGCCSACRQGALLKRAPKLPGMKEWQVRAFFLKWQRDAIAKQRGCSANQVVPDTALHTAARKLVFPPGISVPGEMDRLIRHFRHERTHDPH